MTSHSSVKQGIATGVSIGAAILFITVGFLQILEGISAVAKDDIVIVGIEYTYTWSVSAWGWIHIVIGFLVTLTGFALLTGAALARIAAVIIAAFSIVANFLWLPYYPWWSIIIIALNVVVIWAVSTWNTGDSPVT
ncbi:hypothetical protein ACFQZZ_21455 [Nocardia sp. GCM10030253]|uniref:DUF7144 family membrane protein n=1 Tax=Nocardia sp. GCM10030253 TaxID=3273404 RepID=UPI00362AE1FC